MRVKFICRLFEVDMLQGKLELVEENQWFSTDFFAVYSFPTEIDLTPEINNALNMISHENAADVETIFEGELYMADTYKKATLEIESEEGDKLSVKITAGFESFPNFEKQLAALPLHYEEVPGDFYQFAESKISTGWPNQAFNFPKIIPPKGKFDTSTDQWEFFEGFINNRVGSAFLENEFDSQQVLQINRNVMQPYAYLMHVLQKGFEDAGFTLQGDILEDTKLKKIMLGVESKYYTHYSTSSQELFLGIDEYGTPAGGGNVFAIVNVNGDPVVRNYHKEFTITEPGFYTVQGNLILRSLVSKAFARIKVNGVTKVSESTDAGFLDFDLREYYKSVDFNFTVNPGETATIEIECINTRLILVDGERIDEGTILDVTATQLSKFDDMGNLQPTLITPKDVDLKKVMPETTFGELVKMVCTLRNMELMPRDNGVIEMNRITPKLNLPATTSLASTEKKSRYRGFQKGKTFLLKFQDADGEDYKAEKIYITQNSVETDSFAKKDDTSEIVIKAIVLPQKTDGSITTAYSYIEGNDKLKLFSYDHTTPGNDTEEPETLRITNIYENDYRQWFDFRINAQVYRWKFIKSLEEAFSLSAYDKIYAYRRDHIITKLTKSKTDKDYMELEIETES